MLNGFPSPSSRCGSAGRKSANTTCNRKVATTVTSGVLTCNTLADGSLKNCIDAAVKLAMDIVLKDFNIRQVTVSVA